MRNNNLIFIFAVMMVVSFLGCLKCYSTNNDFGFCFFLGLLVSASFYSRITFQENKNN